MNSFRLISFQPSFLSTGNWNWAICKANGVSLENDLNPVDRKHDRKLINLAGRAYTCRLKIWFQKLWM